jgi:hypothetical protein
MDILEEVVAGFREYFEKALSRILLYRYVTHINPYNPQTSSTNKDAFHTPSLYTDTCQF